MTIEIQVQDGKVTISLGGQPVSEEPKGEVINEGILGTKAGATKTTKAAATASQKATPEISAARQRPVKGAGPPTDKSAIGGGGGMAGVLVIGPIVVGCCADNGSYTDAGKKAAGPSTDKAAIGNGAPLSGAVVIGPIVIGVGNGETGPDTKADNPPPKAVTHHVDNE